MELFESNQKRWFNSGILVISEVNYLFAWIHIIIQVFSCLRLWLAMNQQGGVLLCQARLTLWYLLLRQVLA